MPPIKDRRNKWLTVLGSFDLSDLVTFIGLIIFIVSLRYGGANDSVARESVLEVKNTLSVHEQWGKGQVQLKDSQFAEITRRLQNIEDKLDKLAEKK